MSTTMAPRAQLLLLLVPTLCSVCRALTSVATPPTRRAKPARFNSVLVGDSLLAGFVQRSVYEPVRDACAERLAGVLLSPFEVTATAVDGAPLSNVEQRLTRELAAAPDAVVLLAGTNDLWRRDADGVAWALKRQWAAAEEAGCRIVVGCTLPPYELPAAARPLDALFSLADGVESTRRQVNDEIRRHAPVLLDVDQLCERDPALYSRPDGAHFTPEGYRALGGRVAEVLEAALRALP